MRRYLWMILILAAATSPLLADERYVQSRQAPIWESPNFQADKSGVLDQGQTVEVIEEKGGWVHLRCQEHEGWVPRMMIGTTPPEEAGVKDQQALESLEQRARLRPSAFASTAAARGLMDKKENFSQGLALDFPAVEKMESWRVSDEDAARFLEEGNKHEAKH